MQRPKMVSVPWHTAPLSEDGGPHPCKLGLYKGLPTIFESTVRPTNDSPPAKRKIRHAPSSTRVVVALQAAQTKHFNKLFEQQQ
jgi:hypothetical protein